MSQSGAMELLRFDSEVDFWPTLLGGHSHHHHHHHHHAPASCPHAQSSPAPAALPIPPTANATSTKPSQAHLSSLLSTGQQDKGLRVHEKKTLAGYTRTPHSYYECCINVHVSALLEHWLDWDRPTSASADPVPKVAGETTTTTTSLEELLANLSSVVDPLARLRQYCSNPDGCDLIDKQDKDGRTLLHHLLSGKFTICVTEMCQLLLESGASSETRDAFGDTPLLAVRHLLDAGLYVEAEHVSTILVNHYGSNVNNVNAAGRTLLSFSVAHADRSINLTRFLLNAGAQVWPELTPTADPASATGFSLVAALDAERERSAFPWLLRALMSSANNNNSVDGAEETLYLLSSAMAADSPKRMRAHVQRTMLQMGKSRAANGPLFRTLQAEMMPFWSNPHDLRFMCIKTIRKSLGPKRLSSEAATSRLGLPRKLQHYVELKERPLSTTTTASLLFRLSNNSTLTKNPT